MPGKNNESSQMTHGAISWLTSFGAENSWWFARGLKEQNITPVEILVDLKECDITNLELFVGHRALPHYTIATLAR